MDLKQKYLWVKNLVSKNYFKFGDLIIYGIIVGVFLLLSTNLYKFQETKADRFEIYVNNQLKYTQKLQKKEKKFFIDTDIGGVDVEVKDYKVRVTSSFSPRKLCVKQGWIESTGQTIIGVPDKLFIKIIGEKNPDLDVDIIIK